MSGRRPKGDGSIYPDPKQPGRWRVSLTMGDVGGKRVRRVRNARTKTEAAKLLRTMLAERDARSVEVGKAPTVAAWMQTWLGICSGKLRDQTVIGYRQYDRLYITEQLGKIRLDALTPEHIEVMYANMRQRGLASGSIHSCHRVLRASLGVAVKRGIIRTNPAAVAEPGRLIVPEFEPLSAEEARLVLAAARGRRNGARWTVALALGLRQGEALALTWDAIDLEAGTLWVRVAIHRSPWEHGCRSPGRCTYRNSKGQVVPVKRGADCPQRVGGGFRVDDPKTTGSRRPLALSAPMIGHLRSHRAGGRDHRRLPRLDH